MKDQTVVGAEEIAFNYQLLYSSDKGLTKRANDFFERLIRSERVLPEAWSILTQSSDPNHRTLAATLIHTQLLKHLKEFTMQSKLQLKDLLMGQQGQLANQQQPCSAIRVMSQIVALVAVDLYPRDWSSFLDELLVFGGKDIFCFKSFLEVLQEIPRAFENQIGLERRQKVNFLNTFKQEPQRSRLIELFTYSLSVQIEEIKIKILIIVNEWVKNGFPILGNSSFIDSLIKLTLGKSQQIRENCLDIVREALSKTALDKRQCLESETGINFHSDIFSKEELKSVEIILEFLLSRNEDLLRQIVKANNIEDLQTFVQIIKIMLVQYGYLHLDGSVLGLINLIKSILGNNIDNLLYSHSTFALLEIYLEKLYSFPLQLEQYMNRKCYNIQQLSLQVLQLVVQKIIIKREEIIENKATRRQMDEEAGKMTLWTYREEARRIIKMIYQYLIQMDPLGGIQTFYNHIQQVINKTPFSTDLEHSLVAEMIMFVIDTCFSKDQSQHIQTFHNHKAQEIVLSMMQYINKNKKSLVPIVQNQLMVLISRFSKILVQKTELYFQCLIYSIQKIQQNASQESFLGYRALMKCMPEKFIEKFIYPLVSKIFQISSVKHAIHEQLAQGIMQTILTSSDLQKKTNFLMFLKDQFIFKTEKLNMQYQADILDYNLHLNCLIEIKVLLSFMDRQPEEHRILLAPFFSQGIRDGLKIGIQTINIIFQRENDLNQLSFIKECVQILKNIFESISFLPWNPDHLKEIFIIVEMTYQLFDTDNYEFLPLFSSIIELAATALRQCRSHRAEQIDQFFRQHFISVLDKYIINYFQIACRGNVEAVDPDLLAAYYSFQDGLSHYKPQYITCQDERVVDFAIRFLQLIQPRLQNTLFAFLFSCLKLNYKQKKLQILRKTFSTLPITSECCHKNIAELILILFSNCSELDIKRRLNILISSQNYRYLNEDMLLLILEHLPLYISVKNVRYVKGVLGYLLSFKEEGMEQDVRRIAKLFDSWSYGLK